MKRIMLVGIAIALVLLSGCASMNAPSSSLIDEVPVVRIGAAGEPPKEHILFIPANTAFPVEVKIDGSAFAEAPILNTKASLNDDLYLYQYWASHDGKNWVSSHDMFKIEVSAGVDYSGGKAELKFDYAE